MAERTDVVILCGGRGTRLGQLTEQTPKPLLPVGQHPFLLRVLNRLAQEGVQRVILSAGYRAERLLEFRDLHGGVLPSLEVVVETEPLGTGGALRHAAQRVRSEPFVALNGDSWVTQPLGPVLEAHAEDGRALTMVAVRADRVEGRAREKGVLRIGPGGELAGFSTADCASTGWVNAGLYVLSRTMALSWPKGQYSLERELFSLLGGRRAVAFCSDGRLIDIGTPDVYERADGALERSGAVCSSRDDDPLRCRPARSGLEVKA